MNQEHRKGGEIEKLEKQRVQRRRLDDILGRFVSADDVVYNDRGLIKRVIERWDKDREAHLGDPNE